jgi:hypothetical protein
MNMIKENYKHVWKCHNEDIFVLQKQKTGGKNRSFLGGLVLERGGY